MSAGVRIIYQNEDADDIVFNSPNALNWQEFTALVEDVKESLRETLKLPADTQFDILRKIGPQRYKKINGEADYTPWITAEWQQANVHTFYCAQQPSTSRAESVKNFRDKLAEIALEAEIINPPEALTGDILADFNCFFNNVLNLRDDDDRTPLKIGKRKRPDGIFHRERSDSVDAKPTTVQDSELAKIDDKLQELSIDMSKIRENLFGEHVAEPQQTAVTADEEQTPAEPCDFDMAAPSIPSAETTPTFNEPSDTPTDDELDLVKCTFLEPHKAPHILRQELIDECELFEPGEFSLF